jgi:iron complex transport system ATP-binding protein
LVVISLHDVRVELGGRTVLRGVDLEIIPGKVLGLIGPNGAGKSTLLHVVAGDLSPSSGSVTVGDRAVRDIRSAELSRLRAVLSQDNAVAFPFLVREVVEMGRSPWSRMSDEKTDAAAIATAIARADIGHLLDRPFPSLSGGERARVSLARVLTQTTPVVLLDEPTAALDLRHQEDVMRVARELAADGVAVVVVLHDLSLAGAFAHRLALIDDGAIVRVGTPTEVLEPALIGRVYGLPVTVIDHGGSPMVVPQR